MFDFSFSELLIVAVVTLLVVKPEDIPGILRTIGKGLGKLRELSREWANLLEEAQKQSGMDDLKREMKTVIDLEGKEREAYPVEDMEALYPKGNKANSKNKRHTRAGGNDGGG